MQIQAPCVVSLTWRLEDAHGQLIDALTEPVEFFYGGDDLFAQVEQAMEGQAAGFEATLHLEPEHAFGPYLAELVCFEDSALFPEGTEPGLQFEGLPEGARTPGMPTDVIYTVTEVYDAHVVLDGNHPLAGVALVLQLRVHDVREADDDETGRRSLGTSALSLAARSPADTTLH